MRVWLLIALGLWSTPAWAASERARVSQADEIEEIEIADIEQVTEASTYYTKAFPQFDRTFSLLSARPARPGSYVFAIAHRTNTPVAEQPFYNYLGFDGGGLKIGIGLRYGIVEGLDLGVMRLNGTAEVFDTYELDARYQLLQQEAHFVDLAVRAGVSWFAEEDNQASAYFGQLLANHIVADRIMLGLALMYHSDSSNFTKENVDTDWSAAVGGTLAFRLTEGLSWDVEVAAAVAGYGERFPAFTTGPKIITNRHTFAVVVSNTQYVAADGVVTNSPRQLDELVIGFNITREL